MRFTIDREIFLKSISSVAKAIPQKPILPVLSNIKLTVTQSGLELLASDGDLSIKTDIPLEIDGKTVIRNHKNGSALVQARIFIEIIRRMEGTEVSLELIDDSLIKIDDEKSVFKLNSVKGDEYPDIDLVQNGQKLVLTSSELITITESTWFAASTKERMPQITAVNLRAENGLLTATATDTARLAKKVLKIEEGITFNVNVPAKKLNDIVHSIEDAKKVEISVSEKRVIFAFNNTVVSVQLILGEYPKTSNVFPEFFNYKLEVNSRELLSSMERTSLLSSDRDGVIKIIMNEDEVELISRSSINGSAYEKIHTFQYSGERLEISFRASYVAEAVKAINSEDVILQFVGEMKPFVVRSLDDNSIDMLITPLRS